MSAVKSHRLISFQLSEKEAVEQSSIFEKVVLSHPDVSSLSSHDPYYLDTIIKIVMLQCSKNLLKIEKLALQTICEWHGIQLEHLSYDKDNIAYLFSAYDLAYQLDLEKREKEIVLRMGLEKYTLSYLDILAYLKRNIILE